MYVAQPVSSAAGAHILGEFGVIYKAFMEPKSTLQDTVAVKTLKGELP